MCSVKPQNDLSHKGQAVEEWADLHFFRPIGIRIARALQPTGISADQVTLWSLVIGVVAGHLFAYRDRWTNLIGFALFIVSDVFDSADGQLARLRGTSTRFGRALDGINDNLRFVNLYFHLMYRLIASGFWWPGACLLVAAAGLAHTFQSEAIDFVRNAYLSIGVGGRGELDLPEDLAVAPRGWCCCGGTSGTPRRWAACSTRSTMPTPASPEPRRYRGALIGAGGIARQSHLPALRGAPALRARVDVVAVVDSAPDIPPVDGIPLLRDRAALRDLAPLDFIDICTPTASHLELTLWGLEQGYHVVCEKPVALTRAEAARIGAASRASGRIVMPCHQYRFNPVWQRVKEWLAAGAVGSWDPAEFSLRPLPAAPPRPAGDA